MVGQPTNCGGGSRRMSADQAALSEPHRRLVPPAAAAPGPLRTIVAFAAREASLLGARAVRRHRPRLGALRAGTGQLVDARQWQRSRHERPAPSGHPDGVDARCAVGRPAMACTVALLRSARPRRHQAGAAHAIALVGAAALGLQAARSLGASRRSVWLAAAMCLPLAPWALQMRSQTLAVPLFVALLWLLASDSRRPSRRVLLALPLLVLWANLHGTVVLGVASVSAASPRWRPPCAVPPRPGPGSAVPSCWPLHLRARLLASPYGIDLVGYYQNLLLNPMLKSLIEEWGVSSPSKATALFYIVAFATVALLARQRARLTGFEQLVLLSMLAVAISSLRSIVWFALAASLLYLSCSTRELPREAEPRRSAATSEGTAGGERIGMAGARFGSRRPAAAVVVHQPMAGRRSRSRRRTCRCEAGCASPGRRRRGELAPVGATATRGPRRARRTVPSFSPNASFGSFLTSASGPAATGAVLRTMTSSRSTPVMVGRRRARPTWLRRVPQSVRGRPCPDSRASLGGRPACSSRLTGRADRAYNQGMTTAFLLSRATSASTARSSAGSAPMWSRCACPTSSTVSTALSSPAASRPRFGG